MAATLDVLLITSNSENPSTLRITMLFSFAFVLFLILSIIIFTLYTISKNNATNCDQKEQISIKTRSSPGIDDDKAAQDEGSGPDSENLTRSLLLEIMPSNSPKWDSLSAEFDYEDASEGSGSGQEEKKKKKKPGRKNGPGPSSEEEEKDKEELVCLYPFTKSSSATQRKIKQQYDQLVRSHGSRGLTLAQVGQFVNCLVEARNELQNKSEVIKRRFTITKALLFKADRSSFDRLRQQIYKLELEQKRLEEDTHVYNWLQEQLKVSPAYKKMLEVSACMEMQAAECSDVAESTEEGDIFDISFEELLAQEKKDSSFWQRNGKMKLCSG